MLAVARGRRSVRFAVAVQSIVLFASLFASVPVHVLAAGPANTALALNGSSQYATLGSSTSLRSATFTLELWFKRAAGGATQSTGTGGVAAYPLITKGRAEAETAAADVNYFFGIDASGHLAADFEEGQTGASPGLNHPITGSGTVLATDPAWHHAAATYDGTTWNLYLDGNLDGTLAVSRPANAATNVITAVGTSLSTATTQAPLGFFSGSIDEVRIWNSARSQAQIQATKNSEITAPAAGLLGAWNLNEGTGASLADSSGNSVTGATVATPAWVPGFVALGGKNASRSERHQPVRHARLEHLAPERDVHPRAVVQARRRWGDPEHRDRRRRRLSPDHEGPGRGGDGRRRRQLLLRHRRPSGHLAADFEEGRTGASPASTIRSPVRDGPRDRRPGTTRPRPTTARPGTCISTATSMGRSP